jgi:hypothetical protein
VSRRTAATIRRPRPHLYEEDTHNPGTCARCHLLRPNDVHLDQLPPTDPAVTEAEARRLGEHQED